MDITEDQAVGDNNLKRFLWLIKIYDSDDENDNYDDELLQGESDITSPTPWYKVIYYILCGYFTFHLFGQAFIFMFGEIHT